MKQIEEKMIMFFNKDEESPEKPKMSETKTTESSQREVGKGFARVDEVFQDSPASLAGFRVNDVVTRFGSCTAEQGLAGLPQVVQNSINRVVEVDVIREGDPLSLKLIPKQWSGKGLLGCHVVPIH